MLTKQEILERISWSQGLIEVAKKQTKKFTSRKSGRVRKDHLKHKMEVKFLLDDASLLIGSIFERKI